jgi:OOP family OmpA-OmpF porin
MTSSSLPKFALSLSLALLACPLAAAAPAKPAAQQGAASFDPDSIAETTAQVAPFPYLAYPKDVDEAFQSNDTSPLDRIWVIAGKDLRQIEGKVAIRTFPNKQSGMTEADIRRHYEGAIKAMGGVKVSAVDPENPALVAANGGDDYKIRKSMLRMPEVALSYDVYLIRKGPLRHWIALMINGRTTRWVAIEEKVFVQTIGYLAEGGKTSPVTASGAPPLAPQPVNPETVAQSEISLPPFPYLAYPPKLDQAHQETRGAKADTAYLIVGKQLRALEGRVETRSFQNVHADMSAVALRRNYEAAIKGLGAVKVNAAAPEDPALIAGAGDEKAMRELKLRIPERGMSYDSYLIRTPKRKIWLALMVSERRTRLLAVEEKEGAAAPVTAAAIGNELAAKGRIALYLNFDTDRATVRSDGKAAIDEIITLLKQDPALKLSVEGHTDNQGDARHNQDLSAQRAQAVVAALKAAGIDPARLSASGFGADKPVASNADEAGRAKNRRVELVNSRR